MQIINKTTYAINPIRSGSLHHNSNTHWLYNDGPTEKYIVQDVTLDDGTVEPSLAKALNITNLLQVGELPSLAGKIQPAKYWKTVSGVPKLKSPAERTAVDDALAVEAAEKESNRVDKENLKPKRTHVNRVLSKVEALTDASTNAEIVDVLQDLSPLLYGALVHLNTPVVEDEGV